MPYKLSAALSAHSSDVRAVVAPRDDLVLSASRDTTAIVWTKAAGSSFTQSATLHAGSRYINAVAYLPPAPGAPEGYAVTGGQDTVVNVFALPSTKGEPNFSLLGHTDNVCTLHTAEDGTIISGSWDKTAKVWKDFQLLYDLVGHQQSVWTVLAIDGGQFLTGSADNTIKLWKQHKNVRTYPGHTQAVRGLALITDIGFASCSNDSEIRIWTMEGDCVYTLSGHTSFVYSISVLPNGDIVSGGEDRTVRVWRDGECAQTLVHPAISVWTVATTPNGDIVTGCSDGIVRVFSPEEERWAPADQLKAFDDLVAAQALPAQEIGDIKKSDLPGPEALTQLGKKPGEVKMIRRGESVEAHQWDSASSSWQKIGDVVDAVGSGRKQLYQGREYDFVFDVDVKEGAPPLKLPYNAGDNPYIAAQRFLENNELPLSYLDEVVRFIEKNAGGATAAPSGEQFADPYTGASRYQASQATASAGASDYQDPFTGASRYRAPSAAPTPPPAVATGNDPWTGASRYSNSATSPVMPPPPLATNTNVVNVIPVRTPLSFRQAHVSAMQAKLYQFDQALRNEISTGYLAMYPQELNLIDETFTYLAQAVSHPLDPPSKKLTSNHIDAIIQLLERWPQSQIFPLMDLSRLVLAFCPTAYTDPALRTRFFAALFKGASWNEPWSSPLPKQRETNTLFLLRSLANVFQDGTTLKDGAWVQEVLNTLGEVPYVVLTNSLRVSLTTILFNVSCTGLREMLTVPLRNQLVALVLEILNSEKTEGEAAYRALVALGDIAFAAKEQAHPLLPEHQNTARQVLAALTVTFPEPRIRDVSKEVVALF
ncbi:phospholipase A-2-activating protein [Trametes versicolor FP-101664 SS1]|uniref:phospholipase A-2-activating protein n=1 Tax=Trametes versicolor (strain FP-101664) TaxID=717944 RepID=UPI0004622B04|nr:phospholipase A-2-activating protein [Trametes versicolor FP-101664 SS1]EIW60263.1 phospholipase A-2-activating protein [Trametes versicolor FP-101664 SS1]